MRLPRFRFTRLETAVLAGASDPVQGCRRCEMTLLKALKSDRKNADAVLVNTLDVEDDKERKILFGQGRVI